MDQDEILTVQAQISLIEKELAGVLAKAGAIGATVVYGISVFDPISTDSFNAFGAIGDPMAQSGMVFEMGRSLGSARGVYIKEDDY